MILTEKGEPIPLSGGVVFPLGPLGSLSPANLTSDPETGLGRYSDGQIFRMMRHAVKPDGTAAIAEKYKEGTNRRVLCIINNHLTIRKALMPSGDGWFILVNERVRKKLGLQTGYRVEISMSKDQSDYGMEMPESFSDLMDQDQEGKAYFDQLTPGRKRNLIYIVRRVKNVDSQLRKGLAILDHLKETEGMLDFNVLNQKIKAYNQFKK